MRRTIYPWLGREFVALAAEGQAAFAPAEQTRDIFQRFDAELRKLGLSLDNTVRTRLWGRDRASRDLGSQERVRALTGKARSASSSFIAPEFFESDAQVAVELWAMRPTRPGQEKTLVEYDPPIVPLRYLIYDSVVVLSGVTAVLPTLKEQMADILPRIQGSLSDAGASWDRVQKASFLLHRSQSLDELRTLFAQEVDADIPELEYSFVDGYSSEGKFIEIEVTAR